MPPPVSSPWFLEAKAEAPTEDEAYDKASKALAAALLEDAAFATIAGLEVHRREKDLLRVETTASGTTVVTLGLDASQSANLLTTLGERTLHFEVPEPWRDVWYELFFTHLQRIGCERRVSLFGVTCNAPDTTAIDRTVADLLMGVRLVSTLEGGIPIDAEGKLLRPPTLRVLWHGAAIEGVPVSVSADSEPGATSQLLRSDAGGTLALPTPSDPTAGLHVRLDVPSLLGPLTATLQPRISTAPLELRPRQLDRRRWALVMTTDVPSPSSTTAPWTALDLPSPVPTPPALEASLRSTDLPTRRDALRTAGDRFGGRVDVLVLARARERFAGRGGSGRMWWEANLEVEIYDAWTGTQLERFELTQTALGTTDAKAQSAAREQALREAMTRFAAWVETPASDVTQPAKTATRGAP